MEEVRPAFLRAQVFMQSLEVRLVPLVPVDGMQTKEPPVSFFDFHNPFVVGEEGEAAVDVDRERIVVFLFNRLRFFGNDIFQPVVLLVGASEIVDFVTGNEQLVQQDAREFARDLLDFATGRAPIDPHNPFHKEVGDTPLANSLVAIQNERDRRMGCRPLDNRREQSNQKIKQNVELIAPDLMQVIQNRLNCIQVDFEIRIVRVFESAEHV
jgi:hypothetical protein